ncbi:hypothetical protein [Asanoa siamensis]|uniref:DUF998 domain-containing protein n=1 Tax=Asanoa siamensis TaxID=926357 RepID=A0ABQ4D1K8_9ACTN|nr:hypothetical protein [Asanoa siamensis]GIF77428.1 hypothetical protein Asi02nite_69460 [Asanoa siamensis]
MTAQQIDPIDRTGVGPRLIVPAAAFLLLYLSVDFVSPNVASSPAPRPNAPAAEVRAWLVENPLAMSLTSALQLASVVALAVFVVALGSVAGAAYRARAAGLIAAACMVLSSLLGWVLAAVAPSVSDGVAGGLRTANFIAGGTAHVAALGVFVLLASRLDLFGRGMRVFAWVAAVPAVASLVSLAVYEGAALIPLGRLLCMIWIVVAAITVSVRVARRQQVR